MLWVRFHYHGSYIQIKSHGSDCDLSEAQEDMNLTGKLKALRFYGHAKKLPCELAAML